MSTTPVNTHSPVNKLSQDNTYSQVNTHSQATNPTQATTVFRDVDKNDSVMTRGMAILSMLILHLFCRTGDLVYGTPLIWLNQTTPFVYWFGFFAEICVTL